MLDALTAAGRAGAVPTELAKAVDGNSSPDGNSGPNGAAADLDPRTVTAALARLATEGRAVERARRWYAVSATEYVAGRVDRIDGGDALIRPDTAAGRRGQPELYVEAAHLRGALDGDLVLVKRAKGAKHEAAGRKLPPATVVTIAERRSQHLVGTLETDPDGRRWLAPFDAGTRIELEVVESQVATEARDIPDEHYVVVEVIRGSGSRSDSHPRATVVEHLGSIEEPGVDVLVVLRHYRIPDDFPPEVLAAAAALPPDPEPADWEGRNDLRDVLTVTIDGATARDFDDAITCERLGAGRWRLGVHIADVAHYVEEGSGLDDEAYARATSIYPVDRVIPMLPEARSATSSVRCAKQRTS